MAVTVEDLEAILPQTQCQQCGYEGCHAYAQAMAQGEAINRCPPGGPSGIERLAKLTNRQILTLNPDCGEHRPLEVARIELQRCIGCCKCIVVCPTEAIVGTPKRLHYVDEPRCTGCRLCVVACPMDCIQMQPAGRPWSQEDAKKARRWHQERNERRLKRQRQSEQRLASLGKGNLLKTLLAKAKNA